MSTSDSEDLKLTLRFCGQVNLGSSKTDKSLVEDGPMLKRRENKGRGAHRRNQGETTKAENKSGKTKSNESCKRYLCAAAMRVSHSPAPTG